ncbi:MAG: hypothetical protein GY832_40635 [Chloroflexi bacterium]|nr:hypothetical protein [Chloroflexota bacterium]
MIRSFTGLLLVVLAAGCEPSPKEVITLWTPPAGEIIAAVDAHESLLLESLGSVEITVDWSEGGARCEITKPIAQSWKIVRDATSDTNSDLRNAIELAPNRSWLGAVVASVRRLEDGRFEILYVEGDERMMRAAGALQTILDECGLDVRFEVTIYLKPPYQKR